MSKSKPSTQPERATWRWLAIASVLLLAACAQPKPVLVSAPLRLPRLPPPPVENSQPTPPCFLSSIESYLSGSGPQQIESCLSAMPASQPTRSSATDSNNSPTK